MAEVRFVGLPEPIIKAALSELGAWRVLGERFLQGSRATCPVGRSEAQGGSSSTSGSLKESLEVRFEYGLDPRILVGSTLTRGDDRVSALGLILLGTEAHPIEPNQAKVLHFTTNGGVGLGGDDVFTMHVDHPGTRKNEFVQRAIRRVILENVFL